MNWLTLELEKSIGSANMHRAASNNLVLTNSSSFNELAVLGNRVRHDGLYLRVTQILTTAVCTKQTTDDCAKRLVCVADQAYVIRRFDVVGYLGRLLRNLSSAYESIGHYYEAINLNHSGPDDVTYASSLFEHVADDANSQHRHRALLALGGNSVRDGDHPTAMSFYREVFRIMTLDRIFDPVTAYVTGRMIAVIRGLEGDHTGAVADLEKQFPLARIAGSLQPYAYYDYLNALAVELGEAGRVNEARRASEIANASPFAGAYPEWRDTFDDIEYKQRRASRSAIAVPKRVEQTTDRGLMKKPRAHDGVRQAPQSNELHPRRLKQSGNLVLLPVPKRRARRTTEEGNGRVLSFQQWKMSRVKPKPDHLKPEKLKPEERELLTTPQKLIRIIDLISRDETDDETIDRILDAVEEIALGRPEDKIS